MTGQALRHACAVTAGSELLWEIAAPYVAHDRLAVLPLGVDTRQFNPAQPDKAPYRFSGLAGEVKLLHVASLVSIKDQSTLLRSVALVAEQHPGVHLHVLGDGPLRGLLETEAQALGLAKRVTFHGDVTHERLPDWYRAADLFVLSSRYESQSLVVLEAAACGCPVVGTAVGLLPELLPSEQLAPVGNATALADAIERLLDSRPCARRTTVDENRRGSVGDRPERLDGYVQDRPQRLAEAGLAAYHLATSRYSLRQTVPAIETLYGTVALSAGSGGKQPNHA